MKKTTKRLGIPLQQADEDRIARLLADLKPTHGDISVAQLIRLALMRMDHREAK